MGNRLLISSMLACVLATLATSLANATNGIDLLITSSPLMNIVRGMTAVMLIALLLTNPPRLLALRAALGVVALVIIAASLVTFIQYQIGLLDMFLGIGSAIIMAIDALELEDRRVRRPARLMV